MTEKAPSTPDFNLEVTLPSVDSKSNSQSGLTKYKLEDKWKTFGDQGLTQVCDVS